MKKNKNILSMAVMLLMITLFSKLTGFLREFALARFFGTSYEADAYIIALNVPTILFATFVISITNCFIPQYNFIKNNKGVESANNFTNIVITWMSLISILLVLFVIGFPNIIVRIFGNGFEGEVYSLTKQLVQIAAPMMLAMAISQIYTAFLQSNNCILIPAANNIPYNILLIFSFLFSSYIGIKGITFFSTLFFFTQIIIQFPYVKKIGLNNKLSISINEDIKDLIKLVIPVLISTAVLELNTLIDRSMATTLIEGSVSSLNYAKKLSDFVFGIISVTISAIVYPRLTAYYAQKEDEKFKNIFNLSFQLVTFSIIPILVYVMIFAKEIVMFVYGYGNFNNKAVYMTAIALFCYAIGMVFAGLRDLLNKGYYAMHDTKTPMINSMIATIFNIILNFILIKKLQHAGLAIASSISLGITSILLMKNMSKIVDMNILILIKDVLKATIVAIGIGCLTYKIFLILNITTNSYIFYFFVFSTIIDLTLYIAFCYIINVRAIKLIFKNILLRSVLGKC